ncbi:MAG TPA: hypothetical protein VFH82_08620 [Gemmatimonadota bacterium]|nr:hypothetical protein [Gemmatimonadota bacterium]
MSARMLVRVLVAAVLSIVSAPAVSAQEPVPEAAKSAMEPLAWLAGRWSGEGTYVGPEGTRKIEQTEEIRVALEGALLVVEGTGREPSRGGEPGVVVFRAFGVFSAGDEPGTYRFAAWQGGRFVDARAELAEDGGLAWGFETPDGGRIRYVMQRPEPDVWHEEGTFLAPGEETPRPFFEMRLHREPAGSAR